MLTANTARFTSGLRGASKPLASFGASVGRVSRKVIGFGGALTALAAGAGLTVMLKRSYETIDALAKTSDKLGLATEDLARLRHAAGLTGAGTRTLDMGLQRMTRRISEAAQGTGEARGALAELGLDAAALASMTPDEAFRRIAGAMSNVENQSDRVRLAFKLFDSEGVALVNTLAMGEEGLAAAGAEADRLGLAISRADAAKIEQANDAMTRMQAVFTGAANMLAIQLAPYIEATAAKLTELGTSGRGIGGWIVSGFELAVTAVAKLADVLSFGEAAFRMLQAGAAYSLAGILRGVDWVANGLVDLLNLIPGVEIEAVEMARTFADALQEEGDKLYLEAGEAFDDFMEGRASQEAKRFFDDIRAASQATADATAANAERMQGAAASTEDFAAQLREAENNARQVEDTIADLQRQVEQFDLSDGQKQLADLEALGATPEQLAQAEAALKKLRELEAARAVQENLQSRGQSVYDATRTPLERYEAELEDLSELLDSGVIDWDTYGRAIRDAKDELAREEQGNLPDVQSPDLLRAGEAQAARFAYDLSRGIQQQRKDDLPGKQLDEQREANRILGEVARNTRQTEQPAATVVDL
ncbi:MAG: hypothetical protein AAF656_00455 [Planctomycetota bacterium]